MPRFASRFQPRTSGRSGMSLTGGTGVPGPVIVFDRDALDENVDTGTPWGTLSVANSDDPWTFAITSDPDSKNTLDMDGVTVLLNGYLHYTDAATHRVTFSATNDNTSKVIYGTFIEHVNDLAVPVMTSAASFNLIEGFLVVGTLTASRASSFEIGGTDAALFELSGTTLKFKVASVADTYDITITPTGVFDGDVGAAQSLTIEVREAPSTGAPDALTAGQWTLTDTEAGGVLLASITALPISVANLLRIYLQWDGGEPDTIEGPFPALPINIERTDLTDGVEYALVIYIENSGGVSAASDEKAETPSPGAIPDQWGGTDWSLTDAGTGGKVTLAWTALPADNGFAISDIEVQQDGGSWTSLGTTASSGSHDFTGLTDGTSNDYSIRARNSNGPGVAAATKSKTPTGKPDAFVAGDWSVANPGTGGKLTVTIASLPDDHGATITKIERRVDGGSWVDSGITAPGTFDITSLSNGTSYDIELRCTNANGDSSASDVKSKTPTAAAITFAHVAAADMTDSGDHTTFTYTVSTTKAAILVFISADEAGAGIIGTPTWDGHTMSVLASAVSGSARQLKLFGYVGSGASKVISVTFSGTIAHTPGIAIIEVDNLPNLTVASSQIADNVSPFTTPYAFSSLSVSAGQLVVAGVMNRSEGASFAWSDSAELSDRAAGANLHRLGSAALLGPPATSLTVTTTSGSGGGSAIAVVLG